MSNAIKYEFINESNSILMTIKYDSIDLKKATNEGLQMMMEILLVQEWYEKAAEVRDEMRLRSISRDQNFFR